MESTHLLFIYGTLLPGLRLAHEMQQAECLGPGRVAGRLVDVGRYPGLLPGAGEVHGEIYRLNESLLKRLDHVESMVPTDRAASQYWREQVLVLSGPCVGQSVWTYVYNRSIQGLTPISSGDYRQYIRAVGRES